MNIHALCFMQHALFMSRRYGCTYIFSCTIFSTILSETEINYNIHLLLEIWYSHADINYSVLKFVPIDIMYLKLCTRLCQNLLRIYSCVW